MKTSLCRTDERREEVRAATSLNGLDYLEVSDDQRTLTIYFLGKAPEHLSKDNFRIEGGRRVRNIKITAAQVIRDSDPELDDRVTLRLDRFGDFSTYTLQLINVQAPIDPFYDRLTFSFKVNCPSDIDCKVSDTSPPEIREEPDMNYLAKDYSSFRQLILDRLALIMSDWQERHVPDIGIALAEVLAYTGDYLSYYQDAVATEAYLDPARERISVRRHARLVDYVMHEGCNARAWVGLEVTGSTQLNPEDVLFVTGLKDVWQQAKVVLSRDELRLLPTNSFAAFEPLVADRIQYLDFREEHNTLSFYTWGQRECCLPKGSTSATLLDGWAEGEAPPSAQTEEGPPAAALKKAIAGSKVFERERKLNLKPGDVLIFEEMRGPKTGEAADADPAHRHAVRLTKVDPGIDPLDQTPVLEIEWSPEDALPFPLCLSSIADSEHGCVYHDDISLARGNVVLVDHGESITPPEDLGSVLTAQTKAECFCEGRPGEVTLIPKRYRPNLSKMPLTNSEPLDFTGPASPVMQQDPRQAVPQALLTSRVKAGTGVIELLWTAKSDLLDSTTDDTNFVLEIDNDGRSHLRFGDGDCGRRPEAGMTFSARYRVGNGQEGNVGPDSIAHLVYRKEKPDGILGVRNPLPAQGGVDPEPIRDVKLFAPSAFRKQLQRAITADDYASIAERNPRAQRAGAALRWNGSWYEAQVAIDPLGGTRASETLLKEITEYLYRFRRMGHDLRLVPADYVWLDIALDICVKPEYLRGQIKAALLDCFSNRTLPGGKLGFFHPDKLTFGNGVYASRLVAAALEVEGVESATVTRMKRQFEQPNHEIENGVLLLGDLEIARCDNDPTFPEHGKFELTVHGGR
jgi:hypothetical protein